jgi:hypothetical protein
MRTARIHRKGGPPKEPAFLYSITALAQAYEGTLHQPKRNTSRRQGRWRRHRPQAGCQALAVDVFEPEIQETEREPACDCQPKATQDNRVATAKASLRLCAARIERRATLGTAMLGQTFKRVVTDLAAHELII